MLSDIFEWFKKLCPAYADKVVDYKKEDKGIQMRTKDGYYIHFSIETWQSTGPRDYTIKVEQIRRR